MRSGSETGFLGGCGSRSRRMWREAGVNLDVPQPSGSEPSQAMQSVCWGDPVAAVVGSQSQVWGSGNAAQLQGRAEWAQPQSLLISMGQ